MGSLTQYRGLPRQVYILSLSRVAISMGIMFVFPFLSLFLTSTLGYSEQTAGMIMVISSGGSIAGNLLGGKLADEISRKKVYMFSVTVVILSMSAAGFISNSSLVVPLIMVTYFSVNMILPTISAMILDWSDESNKTECYSLLYLASNVGCAIGPIVAGLLFYSHVEWIFFSMSIVFFITALLVYFGVREIYIPQKRVKKAAVTQHPQDSLIRIVFHKPVLLCFLGCLTILTLCYINLDFILPLQLSDLFGLNAGSKYSSLVWTINGIAVVICTPFIVSVSKKRHPLLNVCICGFLYALGFSFYALFENILLLQFAVIIWTSGEILLSTCSSIYIAEQCPQTHKGRSMALYESARSLGKLAGPLVAGFLLTANSYSQTWLIITMFCVITADVLFLLYIKFK